MIRNPSRFKLQGLTYVWLFQFIVSKGQIKLKADLRGVESPKERTNKFVCFLPLRVKEQKTKFACSFFGRICGAPICLLFYLTFSRDVGVNF